MRARSLKPSLFKNELLGAADPLYTILFEGLWCEADREGRLQDRPLRLRAEVFPYRHDADVDSMLNWLSDHGFISRYEATGGVRVIQILKFSDHQRPHANEVDSVLPAQVKSEPIQGKKQARPRAKALATKDATTSLLTLTPSSLTPDSPFLTPDPPLTGAPDGAGVVLHASLPIESWAEWLSHRRKRRWPVDALTLRKQLATLAAFDADTQAAMLSNSIQAGWQGIFPPKGPNGSGHRVLQPFRRKSADELEAEEGARAGL